MESLRAACSGQEPAKLNYAIRDAHPSKDRAAILALLRTNGVPLSDEEYAWKYDRNPLGRARCWVAVEPREDKLIGHVALFPRTLAVSGNQHRAAVVGDFVVDVAHRSFWPAFLLQRAVVSACEPHGFEFLYAFPNSLARPILLRAGYRSIGQFQVGIRLLRSRAALKTRYPLLTMPGISDGIDLALRCLSKERWRSKRGWHVEELPEFDTRFEGLWAMASLRYGNMLERRVPYANWRFGKVGRKRYSIVAVSRRTTNAMAGYIVWSTDDLDPDKVLISDYLAIDDAADTLLARFISLQRQRGAHSIKIGYFGPTPLVHRFRRFGFLFRSNPMEVVVAASPSLSAAPHTFDEHRWYLLEGDSDVP